MLHFDPFRTLPEQFSPSRLCSKTSCYRNFGGCPTKGTHFVTLENGGLKDVAGFLDEVPTAA